MINKALFSSDNTVWETPKDLFKELDEEFKFTLDPCCNEENKKCSKYYTEKDNGLIQDWSNDIVFMNPPYGKSISLWISKAYQESLKGTKVVALLPARTDTKWFHNYVLGKAEIRFIKGRLKFGNSINSAPFPSMVVIWN